jgi:hypothetical protein
MDQKPYRQKRKAEGKIFEYELKYLHNITIDYYDELLKKTKRSMCYLSKSV